MKRTKSINLEKLRKSHRFITTPVALAVAGVISGCSNNSEDVILAASIDDCTSKTSLTVSECEAAYQQAQLEAERTAPKYQNRYDCEFEFGFNGCTTTSQGYFMPFMTGFLISSALDNLGDAFERRQYRKTYPPVFTEKRYTNQQKQVTANGGSVSSGTDYARVPKGTTTTTQPTRTKTISRGGFGSTASAKSSWGGGKSSGSWGG